MSYPETIAPALLALRSGSLSFSDFSREVGVHVRRRAASMWRRWRTSQELLDEEDLAQVMLLALWRAADTYDPSRGVEVGRYAEVQMRQAARGALRKAAGYPDLRRKSVARRTDVESIEATAGGEDGEQEVVLAVRTMLRRLPRNGPSGIVSDVANLILDGCSIPVAAERIYADPGLRLRYRLDSERDAAREARRAAAFIRGEAEAALARAR